MQPRGLIPRGRCAGAAGSCQRTAMVTGLVIRTGAPMTIHMVHSDRAIGGAAEMVHLVSPGMNLHA